MSTPRDTWTPPTDAERARMRDEVAEAGRQAQAEIDAMTPEEREAFEVRSRALGRRMQSEAGGEPI